MYCTGCGAKNAADSNFCRQCGRKLDPSSASRITEAAFDRALPEEEQVTALLERAYRLRKENDLRGAIALCEEVLRLRPESTTAHGLLGQLYEQNGEREKSIEQYERVLQLNPGSIADRVKLDELRDGTAAGDTLRKASPRVVIMDHKETPLPGVVAWAAGIAALLILSGAALALILQRHEPNTTRETGLTAQLPKAESVLKPNSAAADAAANKEASRNAASSPPPVQNASNPMNAFGGLPAYSFPPPVQYVVYPEARASRPSAVANRSTPMSGSHVSLVARPNASSDPSAQDPDLQGSERVHLDIAEATSNGDIHNPVIKITRHDDSKNGAKAASKPDPDPASIIKVTPHNETPDAPISNLPTADATAMIAVGQEKLNKMDYPGAILAFKKALNGANDETAYVCEKMAECYRLHNENKNAIAMYDRAREEYKKLVSAGRQVEHATIGIRICENGIKICSSE